jgi:SRSO17 transposase
VRDTGDGFKDLVGCYYREFVSSLCGAVMGISGLCDNNRFLMFSRSVSTLSRFLCEPGLYEKLNRRHRKRLLRLLAKSLNDPRRYLWAVDDTVCPNYGKAIWGRYLWWDNAMRAFCNGHKLLVIGLVDRKQKIFIPAIWEILHEKPKEKSAGYEKATEIVLRLLDTLHGFGFPKLTVVADSWFAGETLYQGLDARGLSYVLEIKQNRNIVKVNGRPIEKVQASKFFEDKPRHQIPSRRNAKYAAESLVQFKDSKVVHKVVAVAEAMGLDQKVFSIYVTNKLTWNSSTVWQIARDRWAIEVQFRDLKNLFTLGEAAVRSKESVETSVSIAMIGLTVIRLEQLVQADRNKNQKFRPKSAGYIVREIQLRCLQRGILKLARSSSSLDKDKVSRRINRQNLNRKPAEVRRIRLPQAQMPSWRVAG